MLALRKIAVSVAALFVGLSALFLTAGTATADNGWNTVTECDNGWNCGDN